MVLDVRVPNEMENANTTQVDVQLPTGFVEASYQTVPGWAVKVEKRKLAQPVQTDDGEVTEEVSRITWTADSGGGIAPGQFQDFPLSVQIPDKAGAKLTFKALQTYSNGKIVRWIGPPGSDEPAPQVAVTAAAGEDASSASSGGSSGAEAAPAASSDSDSGSGRADLALGLGAAGLVLGVVALAVALARRRPRSA
jgi:uncharacterized protein